MKKRFAFLASLCVAFAFTSCKRCYDCTTSVSVEYDIPDSLGGAFFSGIDQSFSSTEEVCGTKDEVAAYESENTVTLNDQDVFGSFTQTSTTSCKRN